MVEWLIVGGGIHGTYLSRLLVSEGGNPREKVRVLDPWDEPLHRWHECSAAVGMKFLRSPQVHHLDGPAMSLGRFANHPEGREAARFTGIYKRPGLAFFDRHSQWVIRRDRLRELRLPGCAHHLARTQRGWRVETCRGTLEARRVVLACGATATEWPEWAKSFLGSPSVQHVFDPGFSRANLPAGKIAVIGGGISALQTALALKGERPGNVALISRHSLRQQAFDADPCWLGPKCMSSFYSSRDPIVRRRVIDKARLRGSAPSEVLSSFRWAMQRGDLSHHTSEPVALRAESGRLELYLAEGSRLLVDGVLLATGFERKRPGGELIDRLIAEHELPVAPCGFPRLNARLEWSDGLYGVGGLAELELGPTARNIHGARVAGDRLLAAC